VRGLTSDPGNPGDAAGPGDSDANAIPGRVYVSILGRSGWALLNTYYAVARERKYYPDSVYIVVEAPYRDQSEPVVEGLRTISGHFDFSPRIECIPVDQASIVDVFRKVYNLIRSRKSAGARVALDITPGRKAAVAGLLLPIKLDEIDFVFYLEIATTHDVAKPYQMIPRQFHRLHDLKEQAVRARNDT